MKILTGAGVKGLKKANGTVTATIEAGGNPASRPLSG